MENVAKLLRNVYVLITIINVDNELETKIDATLQPKSLIDK